MLFDYGYAEIAAVVGKSQDNVHQLATRARRHVERRRPRFETTRVQRDELTGDGGGKVPAIAGSLRGRSRVARTLISWRRRLANAPNVSVRPVEVNGGPGAVLLDGQRRLLGVWALNIAGGQITSVNSIVNPDKLTHLGPVGDLGSVFRRTR